LQQKKENQLDDKGAGQLISRAKSIALPFFIADYDEEIQKSWTVEE